MEPPPPEDLAALLRMMSQLQAEVARLSTRLDELTESNMSPTVVDVNNNCGYKTDMEAQLQQAVIEAPDVTTVELRLPDQEPQFFHKCFMCKERFPSSFRWPKQCPRCGTHRWVDGLTKWDRKKIRPAL